MQKRKEKQSTLMGKTSDNSSGVIENGLEQTGWIILAWISPDDLDQISLIRQYGAYWKLRAYPCSSTALSLLGKVSRRALNSFGLYNRASHELIPSVCARAVETCGIWSSFGRQSYILDTSLRFYTHLSNKWESIGNDAPNEISCPHNPERKASFE